MNAANGNIALTEGGAPLASGSYTPGEWFEIEIVANMTLNTWEMFVDGTSAGSFTSGANQVATLDIFPIDGSSNFWVDDVSYTWEEFATPSLNASALNLSGVGALADIPYNPSASVRNNGMENITSFDVEFSDGTNNFSENVTGIDLAPGEDYIIELNEITLDAGQQSLTVTVSNVNGQSADDFPGDDVYSSSPTLSQPATGKRAVVEEGTGTWCQFCPRGAYTMERLDNLYGEYFVGIAVHNGDPMTVEEYDSGIALNAYPSGRVDREEQIGDGDFEAAYLDRMTVAPSAYVTVGAQYDEETRFLEVIVAAEFVESVSGNYKLGFVIVEDSVTGTGSGYNQVNAFSGQDIDMGGYEDLPNPVPASQMVYDHVGRAILPNYEGGELNLPDNMTPGDNYGLNFEITLPEEWDEDHIELVGILYEPDGTANNAYKASLETTIENGWIDSDSLVTGIVKLPTPDADIKLFPNPSDGMSFVTLDMEESEKVSIDVISVDGKTVASRTYGNLSGMNRLPINTTNFAEGLYLIKISVGNAQKVEKLIVE
jgi:hypothetical protein